MTAASTGPTASTGDEPGALAPTPSAGRPRRQAVDWSGPYAVPAIAVGGAALLVVLAIVVQLAGGAAWLPIVRRVLGPGGDAGGERPPG